MAYNIISQPEKFSPVYNYLNYKVQSSASGSAKYEYIADIYINGVLITSLKNAPAPDGYGYFNISRIVENYITINSTSLLTFSTNPGQALIGNYIESLQVKFGDRYGADTPTNYPNLATSNTIYPFAGALTYLDRVTFSGTNYTMNGVNTRSFLTNAPRTIEITRDQNFWLTFLRDDLLNGTGDKFRIYGISDGDYRYEWQVDYNIGYLTSGGRMIRIPASPKLWSTVNASYVTGETWSNISDPAIDTFQICIYNEDLDIASSETFTIRLKDDICKYTPTEIVFLNRFGVFESFVFQLAHSEKLNISRTTYTNANPVSQMNYAASDRRQTISGVDMTEKFTVLSNWISEEESAWLIELITSPITFVNQGGVLIPINIITDDYDVFNKENRKLFNLKLEYKLTTKNDIQRG